MRERVVWGVLAVEEGDAGRGGKERRWRGEGGERAAAAGPA